MIKYRYQGIDINGVTVKGTKTSPDEFALRRGLREDGILLETFKEIKEVKKLKKTKNYLFRRPHLKEQELIFLIGELGVMLEGGINLLRSLQLLKEQSKEGHTRDVITRVTKKVEAGKSLSEALEEESLDFKELYTNMIKAGEATGHLGKSLVALSNTLEERSALKKKIKIIMAYPLLMLMVTGVILFGIVIFIVPIFSELFAGSEAPLPLLTRVVLGSSNFLKNNLIIIISLIVLSSYFFKKFTKSDRGKLTIEKLLFKLPFYKKLVKSVINQRLFGNLSVLLQNGVSLLEALSITKELVGNGIVKGELESATASIIRGTPLSESLKRVEVVSPLARDLVRAGEEGGRLEESLLKLELYFKNEVESEIKLFLALLEPLLILTLAITIGTIILAIYLPIFNLSSVIG